MNTFYNNFEYLVPEDPDLVLIFIVEPGKSDWRSSKAIVVEEILAKEISAESTQFTLLTYSRSKDSSEIVRGYEQGFNLFLVKRAGVTMDGKVSDNLDIWKLNTMGFKSEVSKGLLSSFTITSVGVPMTEYEIVRLANLESDLIFLLRKNPGEGGTSTVSQLRRFLRNHPTGTISYNGIDRMDKDSDYYSPNEKRQLREVFLN